MAQFYGTVQGARGQASRVGTKSSGLTVHANGWNIGATVYLTHEDGRDVVRVYCNGGSNAGNRGELVAEFRESAS